MKKGFTSPLLFWPVLACAVLSPLHAASPDLRDLLRDGLYKEEVNRDPEGAAKTYQDLLARNDEQRAFAATAQFRLAEVRRKQGRKDEAIEAYRQLLIRYPEAETECRIARENLTALGGSAPSPEGAPPSPSLAAPEDGDEAFLATLKDIQTKAPDTLGNKENFDKAITQGYTKSVTFLLKNAPPSSQTPVLTMAVEAGSLEMVKLIYANGVKPNANENRMLLALAAVKNQFFIAQELLKQGIDVNGVPESASEMLPPASFEMAEKNHESITKYLPGTALTTAIAYGNPKLVELILQSDPDVNIRLTDHSFTPLGMAVLQRNLPLTKQLLARHADPNLSSSEPRSNELFQLARQNNPSELWRPLDIAVALNASEIASLLAQNGGSLNNGNFLLDEVKDSPDRKQKFSLNPWVRILVEAGLKPSELPGIGALVRYANTEELTFLLDHGLPETTETEFDPYGLTVEKLHLILNRGLTLNKGDSGALFSAVMAGRQDLVQILLDHGAKIPPEDKSGYSILQRAAQVDLPDETINALIDRGATMSDRWFESEAYLIPETQRYNRSDSSSPSARIRTLLFRKLLMPKLKPSPDIRVALQTRWGTKLETLESKTPSPHPETLERILDRKGNKIDWYSRLEGKGGPAIVTVWHTDAAGQLSSRTADLRADIAFPPVEWGDLVEFSYPPEDQDIFARKESDRGFSTENPSHLPTDLIWKMRQRISFPVSVEMDGQPRELTLTGTLVTFDPTQQKVPLIGAAQLARLISQEKPDHYFGETVTVIRQGWPEIRLLTESATSADFPLQEGDRIRWNTQDKPAGPSYLMKGPEIRLFSPGLPFTVRFTNLDMGGGRNPADYPNDPPAPPSAPSPAHPSLLQALATIYSPYNKNLKDAPNAPDELAAWMPGGLQNNVISVLPHPDLSHIRIHRKTEGDGEEVIEIDLEKAIHSIAPDGSNEDARRADVLLRPGDSVELPLLKDRLNQPWEGFDEAEQHLMQKALSGSIQIVQGSRMVPTQPLQLLPLIYRAPRIIHTPGGLVPLPATEGTSSIILTDLLPGGQYEASSKDGLFSGIGSNSMFLSERFQFIALEGQSVQGTQPSLPNIRQAPSRVSAPSRGR